MEGFIDVHSHILPQIDDGSKSMEQTLNMLKSAYDEGIRAIIATPHAHEGRGKISIAELEECVEKVRDAYKDILPDMRLYLGSEIYYSQKSIELLNEKRIPTLAGTRYVLVEFSPVADYRYIKNALNGFILEGYYPILAHVERYINIRKDINYVGELINMGVYIQVNAVSINGEVGKVYRGFARKLLKCHYIHLIGTDSHSDGTRAPCIKKCSNYILKKHGEEYASELLTNNGGKVLLGEYINN
jgi:protein-tyrosine phosphatase